MKKLLFFLTVLVFCGNTNAQEMKRQSTSSDVSPEIALNISSSDSKISADKAQTPSRVPKQVIFSNGFEATTRSPEDAVDAAITKIVAPVTGQNLTAEETVIAAIKNNGTSPITSLKVELRVNGTPIATETFTGNIAAGATTNYTFTAKVNLSSPGEYIISVRAILQGDTYPANDNMITAVINVVCDNSLPLVQDFQDYSLYCWDMVSNNTENAENSHEFAMGRHCWDPGCSNLAFAFSSTKDVSGTENDRYYQYLISPELPDNDGLSVTFNYAIKEGSGATFRVGYKSSINDDFTWGSPISVSSVDFLLYSGTCPAGTKYVAINYYMSNSGSMLFIDNIVINHNNSQPIDVVSKTPTENAENIAPNAEVAVIFNQNIMAADLTGITINGNTVTASVLGSKLTINHSAFAYETLYKVTVPAGTVNGYNEVIEWSFTTLNAPALNIVSKTPTEDAANVALNAEVSITFNQNITAGNLTDITINGDAVTANIAGSKLIISHDNFSYNTGYTVKVPVGAINGYNQVIEWSFKTSSNPNPALEVVSVTPVNDAANVALGAEVSVTFNQNITSGILTGITVDNGIVVTPIISGSKLTIGHSNFAYNTVYKVTVPVGAINGYNQVIEWSFKTEVQNSVPVVNGNEINIYQNNGEIFITLSENSEICLLDIYGRVLANHNVEANSTLNIHQPAGIYLIKVRCKGNVSTHKIIVK